MADDRKTNNVDEKTTTNIDEDSQIYHKGEEDMGGHLLCFVFSKLSKTFASLGWNGKVSGFV